MSKLFTPHRQYKDIIPPWGPVGYITYKRTYARQVDENRTEEWWETILRVVQGLQKFGLDFTNEELERLYYYYFNMKVLPSGRGLWILGTKYVESVADPLINCWYKKITDLQSFEFVFNELMMGGGVGFSVQAADVHRLPKVIHNPKIVRKDANDSDYIVPDSREGWVSLLRRTLKSYCINGKSFSYSLHCIRSRGAPIKGFGGKASGPDYLEQLITNICSVLKKRVGQEIRTIDALDICNMIAACVVAGNVRRSAEIAIGDIHDPSFLKAKQFATAPYWRSTSNNTGKADYFEDIPTDFWRNYQQKDENGSALGECYGLFNHRISSLYGRLGEERKDDSVCGMNPCGEITLGDGEACNLSELILPNLISTQELYDCAKLQYRVQKLICNLKYLYPSTQEIINRNQRIGLSVTGVMQDHPFSGGISETMEILDGLYRELRRYDMEYSISRGWNPSVRLTTVQPSGTKSLLAGVTHGINPYWSDFAIRRIRMGSNEPLVNVCRSHGYHVEPQINLDGSPSPDTMVVSFPVKAPKGAQIANKVTAIEQLEMIRQMQTFWADNSVSNTVTYKLEEFPDIMIWLKRNYDNNIKSASFMRHQDHGFIQAPYEPITSEQYAEMMSKVKPITSVKDNTYIEDDPDSDCKGGVCQAR